MFIAIGVVILFITIVGVSNFITFVLTLMYGAYYHNKRERDYKPKYISHSMRRSRVLEKMRQWLGHSIKIEPEYKQLAHEYKSPILYACRPHGILVVSAWLTFLSGKMDRQGRPVVVAAHTLLGSIPFMRELILIPLGVIDVSEKSIRKALRNGCSVAIMPGGVKEMGPPLFPLPEEPGIIRIGYELKIPVVPVHYGNEEQLFWVWHNEWRIIKLFRRFIFWLIRAPFVPFFPRVWDWPRELVTHVGKPILPKGFKTHVGKPLLPKDFKTKKAMCRAEKSFFDSHLA